jgi:hypothetical protein
MNEQLHPLTLGEVLDRTAQLYRSRFPVYFGIAVIPAGTVLACAAVVFMVLAWAGATTSSGVASGAGNMVMLALLTIAGLVAVPLFFGTTALGWAAMSHAAARAFLGESISIRESYKSAWMQGWRYLWLYLLAALMVGGAPIAVLFLLTLLSAGLAVLARTAGLGTVATASLGGLAFLLFAGLAVYALWMLLRVCMAFPASVVEQIPAWSAIRRGSTLSKGTKGRIFVLFLLGVSLSWMLGIGISIPVLIVIALIPGATNPQHSQTVSMVFAFAWYGLWFAIQAFTKPVYGIALTLFYFDQRIRTEGFDIECMMHQAGMVPDLPPQPQAVPWLPRVMPAVSITAQPVERASGLAIAPELQSNLPKAGEPS